MGEFIDLTNSNVCNVIFLYRMVLMYIYCLLDA